jgi:hypothetical protein
MDSDRLRLLSNFRALSFKTAGASACGDRQGLRYQAACLLLVIALHFQADFIGLPNKAVTDATGRVWQTGDIYTTGALASIFTLIFASVLGFIKIARMEKTFEA